MSRSISRSLLHAACLAAAFALGSAQAAAPVASKAPQALKFANGSETAKVKGKFKGPQNVVHDYAVPMKAGQTLEVVLTDKPGTTYAYIFLPNAPHREGEGRKKWTLRANVDGTYIVHVFLTQSSADKGESSSYELSVTRK